MLSKLQRRAIFYSGIGNDFGVDIRSSETDSPDIISVSNVV